MPERSPWNARLAGTLARTRVPIGFLCGAAVLWLSQPTLRSLAIGGIIAGSGELLRIWAAGHLEKGQEVTQSGPYRLTRHPLYVGSAIIALGAAFASARPIVAVLISAYMSVTVAAAIHHEEAGMRASFGDQYDAYLESRVTLVELVERPFSLDRVVKNKEYRAVAGLAAFAVMLAMKAVFR